MLEWLRKKSAQTYSVDQIADLGGFVRFGTSAGVAVTAESAVQVPAVLCATKVLCEGVAQMPIRVLSQSYNGDRVSQNVLRDFWAHKLLSKRPNEFQTSFEFREYMMICAILDKGFLGIKNTVKGEIKEILPLPMGSWSIERNVGKWSHFFRVSYANGTTGEFTPDQCVYFRGPSLDGWRALPALGAAREAIGLARVLEAQQSKLASNGGKPSGVLSFSETLAPEARDRLRETWQQRFGPNGEGGIAILDKEATYQSLTMTSVDAQTLESRNFQIEEIARALRVHPIMMMHSNSTTTFASAEQHFRNHVIHTLGPWMVRMEQALNRDVLGNDANMRVDLDERALLRGDFKDQAEYYTKALGAGGQPGWMSPNEIRAERDMDPYNEPWADQVPRGAMNGEQGDALDVSEGEE